MKLASFEVEGRARYGLVSGDGYLMPPDDFVVHHPNLASVLHTRALPTFEGAVRKRGMRVANQDAKGLPVIPRPGKIICVGLNYKSHVEETRRDDSEHPALFARFAESLGAHGADVSRPSFSDMLDFEGELAVVIGSPGQRIPRSRALEHVAGYSCFNDITVRDWQRHTSQWTPGKNFTGTGTFGPWLTTADEIGDLSGRAIETRVNGEVMQHASLSDLIFDVPFIIEYVSKFTALATGDVIATGTPGGVGDRRHPPRYLKPGDTVEVEITGLGTLRNRIVGS